MTAPFGISFHADVHSFNIISELGQGKYIIEAPTPHPSFVTYVVQATPEHGVVWIKGLSADLSGDQFGNATRSLVDRIASQLESKYGRAEKTDLLFDGSIWDEPRDWMSGLSENQRMYFYVWERPRAKGLPDDIKTIFCGANASDSSTGGVSLEYASVTMAAAEAYLENEQSSLL